MPLKRRQIGSEPGVRLLNAGKRCRIERGLRIRGHEFLFEARIGQRMQQAQEDRVR